MSRIAILGCLPVSSELSDPLFGVYSKSDEILNEFISYKKSEGMFLGQTECEIFRMNEGGEFLATTDPLWVVQYANHTIYIKNPNRRRFIRRLERMNKSELIQEAEYYDLDPNEMKGLEDYKIIERILIKDAHDYPPVSYFDENSESSESRLVAAPDVKILVDYEIEIAIANVPNRIKLLATQPLPVSSYWADSVEYEITAPRFGLGIYSKTNER